MKSVINIRKYEYTEKVCRTGNCRSLWSIYAVSPCISAIPTRSTTIFLRRFSLSFLSSSTTCSEARLFSSLHLRNSTKMSEMVCNNLILNPPLSFSSPNSENPLRLTSQELFSNPISHARYTADSHWSFFLSIWGKICRF